ncbi:hypothetical protein PAGU2638_00640 [Lysobacter sp. PAGU 2638]
MARAGVAKVREATFDVRDQAVERVDHQLVDGGMHRLQGVPYPPRQRRRRDRVCGRDPPMGWKWDGHLVLPVD